MNVFDWSAFASVVCGRWLVPPAVARELIGVGIDTREDLAGRAFFAIKGERHDGHDFLDAAVRAGASALVVHQEPKSSQQGVPVLLVNDTRQALARLARSHRESLRGTVIAITGSAGKTTTKRMIHAVLSTTLRGSAAPKSFNNDIGVPLTLLAASPDDDYVVVEVGMNHPGEIASLAEIVQPDIAIITSIGRAHLEGLGSIAAIATEKASLLKFIRPGGVGGLAIVNGDSRELRSEIANIKPIVRFGKSPDSHLLLTARGCDEGGWWFEVNGRERFRLGLPGRHNAMNALAAVAVGRRCGIADAAISEALGAMPPDAMRMSERCTGGITIWNDAYNANPDSMIAAIETFTELTAGAPRRILILGDMLELGSAAPALHHEIGDHIARISDQRGRIDHVVLVGGLSIHARDVLIEAHGWPPSRISHFQEVSPHAMDAMTELLFPGDAVLLKASRGMALERIAAHLESHGARKSQANAVAA